MSFLEAQRSRITSFLTTAYERARRQGRGFATTLDFGAAALASGRFHDALESFCGMYLTTDYLLDRAWQLDIRRLVGQLRVADETFDGVQVSEELLAALTHIESGLVLDDAPFRLDDLLEEALLAGTGNFLLALLDRMGVDVKVSQRRLRDLLEAFKADPQELEKKCEPEVDNFPRYRGYLDYFCPSDQECGIVRGQPGEPIRQEEHRSRYHQTLLRFAHDELKFDFEPIDDTEPTPAMALIVRGDAWEDVFVFGRNGKWHSMSNLHEYTDDVLRKLDHQMLRRKSTAFPES